VVHGISNDVGQRILDRLDDGAIEVRLLADHLEPDLLAEGHGKVADDPRELAPDVADGLHAGLHDPFLQLRGQQVQPLRRPEKRRFLALACELKDLVAGQDELADEVHQLVEQPDVDADGRVGDAGPRFHLGVQRLHDGLRLDATARDENVSNLPVRLALLLLEGALELLRLHGACADENLPDLRNLRRRDLRELGDDLREVLVSLVRRRLDALQKAAHAVDHGEEGRGYRRRERQVAVA